MDEGLVETRPALNKEFDELHERHRCCRWYAVNWREDHPSMESASPGEKQEVQ